MERGINMEKKTNIKMPRFKWGDIVKYECSGHIDIFKVDYIHINMDTGEITYYSTQGETFIENSKNSENFELYNTELTAVYAPFVQTSLQEMDEILKGLSEEEIAQKLMESYNEISKE